VTKIVFWEPFALDRPQGLLLGEMVRDFEKENPDILVEIVPKNGALGIHDAVMAELPDGDLPDLAVAFPSMIAQYARAGAVVPLDPYLYDPEVG
jgi:ABC-type glycerol-3-phosphate transport system substrate-binding protein